MRVTDRMLFDRAARDGGAARARLEKAVGVASTGAKLVHPGDDPAGAGMVTRHRATAARAEAVAAVAARASDELAIADSALGDVTSALARAREIATQFASAGYDAPTRANAAAEVGGLFASVIAALNAKVGSRYLFAGLDDGVAPFGATGTYAGDQGTRSVEVAPGVWQAASLRADVAFKGTGGGVDVLDTLTALRTALAANDQAGVAATLTALATSTEQVATLRGQAGIAMSAFDAAISVNQRAGDDARSLAAHLTDADAIQANAELALAQRGLEASLTATSRSFKLTLLDYLK
jgi:flagellar hook-associated protein 3 FlgL